MRRLFLLCFVSAAVSTVRSGLSSGQPLDVAATKPSSTTTVVPTPPTVTTPSPFANKTPADGPQTDPPRAAAPAGSFRGSWMTSRRGRRFQAYRGIKYAEPPVEELRFQPPKPILEYKSEVDASQDGPACPRPAAPEYPMDEDCLTINVYTPDSYSSKPLPVIFFMHPGGFYSMSGRSDVVGPHYLLDKDIVLVSINYRLGTLAVTRNASLLKRMNEEWDVVAPIAFDLPTTNSAEAARRLKRTFLQDMPLANDDISNKRLGQLYRDGIGGFNIHRMANLMCRHSPHNVYYSEFAYIGNHSYYEDPTTKKPIAAAHHDDLIYLFSQSYRFPTIGLGDGLDSQLVNRMTALWYNFAKTGDPNPSGSEQPELAAVNWPAMKPDSASYLRIGDEFSVGSRMFENRFQVWEDIYPIEY